MPTFRHRLPLTAAVWLVCQLAAFAAAPLALCCSMPKAEASVEEDECCKGLGPGQICPMHHHTKPAKGHAKQSSDARGCVLKSACKAPDIALMSILGCGVLPQATAMSIAPSSSPVSEMCVTFITHTQLPDKPPPRA